LKRIILLVVLSCALCVTGILVMKTTIDPTYRSLGELIVVAGLAISALPLVGVVLARQAERRVRKRAVSSSQPRDDR
jgi:hypothetical protein